MAMGDPRIVQERPGLRVPYAVDVPDRIRKERYDDPDFYAMEVELLWPRVWQMACRLEEIPRAHDFVEYEILDQSVVVVRTEDLGVRAFQNACRHRGVRVAQGRGTCENGFTCPFHGWCYGPDGRNTFVPRARTFGEHNLQPGDVDLTAVRCEAWGGCAWINLDAGAPPLRACLEPVASVLDAWKVESLRTEWWSACRLPVNWKLAEEAFVEHYHVLETHPQLRIPGRYPARDGSFDPPGVRRVRAALPAGDERGHGRDGPRRRRAHRRGPARRRAARRPGAGPGGLGAEARRRRRGVAPRPGPRRPRPDRARGAGPRRADGLRLPALVRAADVQQRLVPPVPAAGAGGDADGDLVAHPVPAGRGAGAAPTARAVGVRRPPLAADPRTGLLGWSVRLVGRYHDTLHHDSGRWRFHRRTARFEGTG